MPQPEFAISLGGSLIIPHESEVRDLYVCEFAVLLKERVDAAKQKTAVVTGGGRFTRLYQDALRHQGVTDSYKLDEIGILPTHTNALFVTDLLTEHGVRTQYLHSLTTPLKRDYDAWVTGGTKPGQDTDGVLAELAGMLGINQLINATNVAYVYERNREGKPDFNKPIKELSWNQYFELMKNERQEPGKSLPFGITAARKVSQMGLSVIVLNGNDLDNLNQAFAGKDFVGTTIHP